MAKILDDKALKEILDEVASPLYFFQKEKEKERPEFLGMYEDDGSIMATFLTGIAKVEPGEKDLVNRDWHPPLKDKDGNPILDRQGNPREAWDKFEVKCKIKDKEIVYGLGGKNGVLFRGIVSEMKNNSLSNDDIPNTKWRIKCVDSSRYKWDIEYLGKENETLKKEPIKETKEEKSDSEEYDRVVKEIIDIKDKNKARVLAGLDTDELVEAASFKAHVDDKLITSWLPKLEEDGVIKIAGNKIYIQ